MTQITLPLEFREFEPSQYERLADIYGRIFPERERSVAEWRFFDESLDKTKYHFRRYACLNVDDGEILGFGELGHAPWMFHPKKFWLEIWVDPQHQGKGVGKAIYQLLSEELNRLGAVTLWTGIREDMPRSLSFVEKRGFHEKRRGWESILEPGKVSLAGFRGYAEKASRGGIRISTLAQEQKEYPDCLKKLYDLVQEVFRDVPMPEKYTPSSYDQWLVVEMKSPNLIPEGYMIAVDGPRYVGLSVVWRIQKEPQGLYQGLTGVGREYRGRGLAIALKLRVIDFARANGFDEIITYNDTMNDAMLGINMKLGFKRQVGWVTFEKNLT